MHVLETLFFRIFTFPVFCILITKVISTAVFRNLRRIWSNMVQA